MIKSYRYKSIERQTEQLEPRLYLESSPCPLRLIVAYFRPIVHPRRFEADQKNREFLRFMAECEARSKANPRKVVNVAPGFYFLTVEDQTWSIVHDREAKEWVAYVGNFIEADPKRTKREMVASLLA